MNKPQLELESTQSAILHNLNRLSVWLTSGTYGTNCPEYEANEFAFPGQVLCYLQKSKSSTSRKS
jgi:hypothetical protein